MALKNHHDLKATRTIPRRYKPPKILTSVRHNSTLSTDFEQNYEALFFQHLDKVITNDNVTLELTNAATSNILAQTETYLASLHLTPQSLTELYKSFLHSCQLTDRQPLPVLLAKLTTNEITRDIPKPSTESDQQLTPQPKPNTGKGNRKRKRKGTEQHPTGKKHSKQQIHFLSQGQLHPLMPP